MKPIFTFLFVFFFLLNLAAQETPQIPTHLFSKPENLSLRYESDLLDSVIDWEWNLNNAVWDIEHLHKFFYDEDHYVVEYQSIFWTGTEWKFSSRHLYSYDDHHNLSNLLLQSWNGFEWTNNNQRIYTYDNQDNEISNLAQFWNGIGWDDKYRTITEYNVDGERVSLLNELWIDTAWINQSKDSFEYVNHVLESATSSLYNIFNEWENWQRVLYTYQDGNLVERRTQNWDGADWADQSKYQYSFDGDGNNTYYLQQRFVSGAWTNRYQTFFEHTSFNEVFSEHGDQWINDAWGNYYEYSAQFDNRENLSMESNRIWDADWVNTDSSKYFYTYASSVENEKAIATGFSVSPNPASDQLFVHLDAAQEGTVTYRIYSLDGRIMETSRLDNPASKSINVSQYASGSYILQVKMGDQWKMKVFVKK